MLAGAAALVVAAIAPAPLLADEYSDVCGVLRGGWRYRDAPVSVFPQPNLFFRSRLLRGQSLSEFLRTNQRHLTALCYSGGQSGAQSRLRVKCAHP